MKLQRINEVKTKLFCKDTSTKKTVFMTGSANGIIKHLSDVFCQQGHNVVATDSLIDKLDEQTKGWNPETCLIEKLNIIDTINWQNIVQRAI